MTFLSLFPRICLGALLCTLTGCLVGPRYHQPPPLARTPQGYPGLPAHYKEGRGWKVAQPQDATIRGQWWKLFQDAELNGLEQQLTINDQNIKQFFQNFMEARALVGETNAQLYPTLSASASYTRALNRGLAGSTIPVGLDLSWEPDLWGRVRNALRAAQYNAQISAADLENERLSEQASLATYYYQLRGQDSLEALYDATIAADQKALDYARAQYDTGITDKITVVEATNTLQNAQATRTNLGINRAQYEHAIAVLVGQVASNFSIRSKVLSDNPPPIPDQVPSRLLERRPDVAASERAMAAANAQIGVAYAAFFPTVTLGASGGYTSSAFRDLFSGSNRTWSIGPGVTETIFDAGLRNATVHQYVATYNASLAAYRENVLTAFQQVEDNLAQVNILAKQAVQQRDAEKSAEEYLKLELDRYKTGVDPYIDVVTAQTTLLSDQQAVINVQIQEMTSRVQLIKALGGGWDRSRLPTASQVFHDQSAVDPVWDPSGAAGRQSTGSAPAPDPTSIQR